MAAVDEPAETPADVALTALLAAQVAAWEVEATEALLDVADDWIASHGATHRLYEEAIRRRRGIESRWCVQQRVVWTACCQLWHGLTLMVDRQSWLRGNAPEIDAETLEGIWGSLMGERQVPFGVVYPVAGALSVPTWQRDELIERREKQRATAKRPRKTKEARS